MTLFDCRHTSIENRDPPAAARRANRRLGFLAVILLAAGLPVGVASDRIGPIEVISLSQRVDGWRFGYIEHRLQLRNLSSDRVHSVEVILPAQTFGASGGQIERISRTVTLHPRDTAVVSLPQPARAMHGNRQARITVRGGESDRINLPSMESAFQRHSQNQIPVFVARGVNSDDLLSAMEPHFSTAHGHRGGSRGDLRMTRAESEIVAWSPNWLAYAGFAGVFLSADEWRAPPAAVRDALLRYASGGGLVVCTGEIDPPARWILGEHPAGGARLWAIGFGHVASVAAGAPPAWEPAFVAALAGRLQAVAGRWPSGSDVGNLHRLYPVIDNFTIPFAGIFYLLLGFSILAGPVLLAFLARWKRRIWLLWIVPAAASLTGGMLLVYALLSDGVTPTRRADTLAWLDQVRMEGVLFGLNGFYAPLTPSDGLRFSTDTAVAPFEEVHPHSKPSWRLDFTRDQHLASGWIQARVPLILQVRKPFAARERLDIQPTGEGGVSVVNGLGVDVRYLAIRDADGRWYAADRLAAGRRVDLMPDTAARATTGQSLADVAAGTLPSLNWAGGSNTFDVAGVALQPGQYAAELSASPFLERGLTGRMHHRERSLLVGRYVEIAADH